MPEKMEFRREQNRNYMILHPESEIQNRYTIRMLAENRMEGLLYFQEKRVDEEVRHYYDITSRQPLNRLLEHRSLKEEEIRSLVFDVVLALRQLERFLLDENQLCLIPEMIYVEPDTFKSRFCLIPGQRGDFSENFRILAQYLLDHVDHSDGNAVMAAFGVFKESRKENFGIEDIERCVRKCERKEEAVPLIFPVEKLSAEEKGPGEERDSERGLEGTRNKEKGSGGNKSRKTRKKEKRNGEIRNSETGGKERRNRENSCGIMGRGNGLDISAENMEIFIPESVAENRDAAEIAAGELPGVSALGKREMSRTFICFLPAGAALVMPIFLFLSGKLWQYPWVLGFPAVLLMISGLLFYKTYAPIQEKIKNADQDEEQAEEWEILFQGEAGMEDDGNELNHFSSDSEEAGDELQTVLLSGRPAQLQSRKLVPDDGGEEIPIQYFPFLIGKNEMLADLCLPVPEISRLHAKIEETDDGYTITDLNSTNGTTVDGHLLETNETHPLKPGAEIGIAAKRFRFL